MRTASTTRFLEPITERIIHYNSSFNNSGLLKLTTKPIPSLLSTVRPLCSVGDLAAQLRNQGKHDEAEAMNRRALDGYEKVLGEEHPYTLTSVSNLASVLRDQGKYEEAETINLEFSLS